MAVSTNYDKKYRFSLEERIDMAKETFASLRGIVVEPVGEGLLAEYCRQRGVSAIVKGLRSSSDFDYELPMATMNRQLTGVETVFLPAESHYLHLSSTLIKEVFALGGDVSDFVPRSVLKRLARASRSRTGRAKCKLDRYSAACCRLRGPNPRPLVV